MSEPRISTATPNETYFAVGRALSYWEASEDEIMRLFNWLCGDEPVAITSFISAPRMIRGKMLKDALNQYARYVLDEEKKAILKILKKLDFLAATRNQIAHGHVSSPTITLGGKVTMQGVFLLPALSESGAPDRREFRYALTAQEINAFCEEVREQRWELIRLTGSIINRGRRIFPVDPRNL